MNHNSAISGIASAARPRMRANSWRKCSTASARPVVSETIRVVAVRCRARWRACSSACRSASRRTPRTRRRGAAADAGFDVVVACAFNFDAHSAEFDKLGRIPVLKARMNADLHMAGDLKNTGQGNLFVIFGEPDIEIEDLADHQVRVRIRGVDVFHPQTGEIESSGPDGIACWLIDTDYNEESFFVRHAYFLGANDPYSALKTTLKAEINVDDWVTLNSDTSRPFDKPQSGRIAVKVINHLGDEVMKVFKV